jgi:GTPase involved in cell partitioning and DNA repair
MKEKNELLMHIYETCDMGVKSTTKLIDLLRDKDNKIKKLLEDELKEYEKYLAKSEKLLKKNKVEPEGAGMMAEMMAKMSMKMDIKKDNSDSSIADMLIKGVSMGSIDMEKKIKDYEDSVDKHELKFAKDFLKFQQEVIEGLKKFL